MNMNRRFFIGLSSSFSLAGCIGTKPGASRPEWRKGHYQVHFIYTGRSECMFHIFPDGTSMMLDCGDSMRFYGTPAAVPVPDLSCRAGEFAARYVREVNPKGDKVDILHLSHYHEDHAGGMRYHGGILPDGRPLAGISDAARFLTFARAVDRAWPGFDDPIDLAGRKSRGGVPEHMKLLYRHLSETQGTRIERFSLGTTGQFAAAGFPGFSVFNLCANGRYVRRDGSVRDLYADQAAEVRSGRRAAINENAMSCGMIVRYGKFSYFTAGDFSDGARNDLEHRDIENELAEAVGPVTVAKLNHHGHHSMPSRLVAALKAKVWTNCTLDQQHCTDDSMSRLADRGLYAGARTILPTYMPHDRPATRYGNGYLADVPECVMKSPCHVVMDVPPEGDACDFCCCDAMKPGCPVVHEFRCQA